MFPIASFSKLAFILPAPRGDSMSVPRDKLHSP